jgi:hypothetical protein
MLIILVILVVLLVLAAIAINTLQQQKEKQETDRKRSIAKQKAIIQETEDLLMNANALPMSPSLTTLLQKRNHGALLALKELMPSSVDVKLRLEKMQETMANPGEAQPSTPETFSLPDNEQLLIAILQGVKKLRAVLRAEQSKGSISPEVFQHEDMRLELVQLKISVESMMRRGEAARNNNMIGSARQYYEKALKTLSNQPHSNDYVSGKIEEINDVLASITETLKTADENARRKQSEDDLDVLFQPKKKW